MYTEILAGILVLTSELDLQEDSFPLGEILGG
jgi:hypothetical protein